MSHTPAQNGDLSSEDILVQGSHRDFFGMLAGIVFHAVRLGEYWKHIERTLAVCQSQACNDSAGVGVAYYFSKCCVCSLKSWLIRSFKYSENGACCLKVAKLESLRSGSRFLFRIKVQEKGAVPAPDFQKVFRLQLQSICFQVVYY